MGAIVTASGTGSEMNAGAVITNENQKIKCGLFGAQADFAFLDPTYTMSVPFKQVISGAFDTLSHAMETYFGKPDENNISDDFSEAVMRSVIKNMQTLLKNPDDYEARSELMWASSMAENGILKIGKITDFQAHQIEHQLGHTPTAITVRDLPLYTLFCTVTSTRTAFHALQDLPKMYGR